MNILQGTVIGVIDKGENSDKKWAVIGLQSTSKDRDGFDVIKTHKVRVFGDMYKGGMHNAYRSQQGVEVFMPVNVEVNERYKSVEYSVAGIPLRLQEARPLQTSPAPITNVKQA